VFGGKDGRVMASDVPKPDRKRKENKTETGYPKTKQ
jgi:hypothetical protein